MFFIGVDYNADKKIVKAFLVQLEIFDFDGIEDIVSSIFFNVLFRFLDLVGVDINLVFVGNFSCIFLDVVIKMV